MSDEPTTSQSTDPHAEHRQPLAAGTPSAIGRYELLRVLGGGTAGRVYLAFDPKIERYVAIKMSVLPPESHRKFLREARMIAGIHHPNICPVYDVGEQNDLPYIVMRYVAGGTLDKILKRGLLRPDKALRIAGQIAKGLESTHACGVFHRDLKPANVLYDDEADEILLTDFGIAHWSESATMVAGVRGTPAYMAPEQWSPGGQFGDVSPQTDLYSLGALLFRMLTGISLFPGDSPQQMFHHCFTQPRKPSEVNPLLGTQFDDLVLKALAKQPAERYANAIEFANVMAECLRPSPPPRAQKWQITVPGEWWFRPAGGANGKWKKVAETPAEVTTRPGEVYLLSVSSGIQDATLAGLMHLKSLTTLQTLDLSECDKITDEGLMHLKALTALQSLDLSWCRPITDAGIAHLKKLTTLQSLSLSGCENLTDAGLAHLKELTSLQSLCLSRCLQLTDEGLVHLKALTALRKLDLSFCKQLPDTLARMNELAPFQKSDAWSGKITDAGIAELQQALPNCEIIL